MAHSIEVWGRLAVEEARTLVPGQDLDVAAWLRDLGLERYAQAFLDAEVTSEALPERFGPWRTVATRFYRWTRAGLWERLLDELRRLADAKGGIDGDVHMVDGTSVRAHRCAAGAKGGGGARRWAARGAGSAASCTSAAIVAAGPWRSC